MSFVRLQDFSLYLQEPRAGGASGPGFAPLPSASRFICISSALSNWSNKGEMQI
jgi:hypothetical protein